MNTPRHAAHSIGIARRSLLKAGVLASSALGLPTAWSQRAGAAYPDRPIKLLVPFPAGALTDSLARLVAERLRLVLGQTVVVENRPGAGTLLGAAQVAKAAPDGYSLMVATTTTLAISPAMYAQPPAVTADFVGVAMIGAVSLLLVARPDMKVRTLPELVAEIRREPGRLNFGSPGSGTMHHLIVEMIKAQDKLSVTHVPYQGSVPAVTDLMAGRIDFMFLDVVAAMPQVQAGKLNVLAVAADKRLAALPNVPTVTESYPHIDVQAWQSVAAPKDTPPAIVARLNAAINSVLSTPEGREALQKMGVEAMPLTVVALAALIAKDEKRFGDLVRAVGLKAG